MPLNRVRPNTVDADCWNGIVNQNEYNLPAAFAPGDLIVDIGTHVGSFVQAVHDRGARRIISFEADQDNARVAYENVGSLPASLLVLSYQAVGRSDARAQSHVSFSGYEPFFDGRINTGGGTVFARESEQRVPCIPFDRIAPGEEIRLLKLDCEGSEWPILYTSRTLSRVQQIVGEYHTLPHEVVDDLGLAHPCTPDGLHAFLRASGFRDVTVQPYSELHAQHHNGQQIGLFWATR